ncbi:MAG: MCE family protein, partial [bacterium]|nr:MCE family protein [bacterium]
MPSAKKVRWAQLKVGILSVSALVLMGVLVFLMTGDKSFFASEVIIHTFLDDSYAITPGSPVRLNGILIGKIQDVRLSGEAAANRIIRVDMLVQQDMLGSIPTDSVAAVSSENVLGSKYINIKKGVGGTPVEPGGEIASLDTRDFEEVVASGHETLTALRSILQRIDAIVAQIEVGQGSIGKLLTDDELYNNLTGTVVEARKVTEALNKGEGTIGRLLYDGSLYEELRQSVARIDQIIEDVESGQGTAGKFLKDPAVYDEARAAV